MYTRSAEVSVVSLLRQCYGRKFCQASRLETPTTRAFSTQLFTRRRTVPSKGRSLSATHRIGLGRRGFSSTTSVAQNDSGKVGSSNIAVLGGGVTGLSTAYYLSREFPHAKITLYEGSERLGGWLRSTPVEVEGGTVLFEGGPRTLRASAPSALATLEIISDLGLHDQILYTSKQSLSAQNRFVYYPDHLVRMPGPGGGIDIWQKLWTLYSEPVFDGLATAVIGEHWRDKRPSNIDDESLGSFITRRAGGPELADNLVSAVLHGIYAGDIWQLSAKSLLPKMWWMEERFGSLSMALSSRLNDKVDWILERDMELMRELTSKIPTELSQAMGVASVYTFKQGIGHLATSMENHLKGNANVRLQSNKKVKSLTYDDKSDNIKISTYDDQPEISFDTVISTLSASNTADLAPENSLPSLAQQKAVTVMTVNLYYRDPYVLSENGFGYLIPRSIPYEQNPECALGVVFDSDSSIGQDTATGTKLTVMLGGHWWDGFASTNSYPTEEEGLEMAKSLLRRHLGIEDEPEAYKAMLHKNCIPQYTVGHSKRMKDGSMELEGVFKGKLRVAGSSYGGVGLNDCVRSARDVVMRMKEEDTSPWAPVRTGLEDFAKAESWIPFGNLPDPKH